MDRRARGRRRAARGGAPRLQAQQGRAGGDTPSPSPPPGRGDPDGSNWASYVLTTGTGSGKSLAYIVPIVDHVLRARPGKGIQAIVVYPMNALANSQAGELEKFLRLATRTARAPSPSAATPARRATRSGEEILANPPDILLTNYVMLELILTRPFERKLVEAARAPVPRPRRAAHLPRPAGCGRRAARARVREACEARRCSASARRQRSPDRGRSTSSARRSRASRSFCSARAVEAGGRHRRDPGARDADLDGRTTRTSLRRSELASATRTGHRPTTTTASSPTRFPPGSRRTFGMRRSRRAAGSCVRRRGRSPGHRGRRPSSRAHRLGRRGRRRRDPGDAAGGIRCLKPETGFPVFAFRLHQFFSRGDTVWARSSSRTAVRHHAQQQFVPGDRRSLLPLVFCRECGQEYYPCGGT